MLTGKLTVNFAESDPSAAISTSGQRMNSMASSRIPYATEQGISKRVIRELFPGTWNFNSLIAGVYAAPNLGIGTLGSKVRRLACSSG